MRSVINSWASVDATAAATYVDTLDLVSQRMMSAEVANAFINQHPDEGFAWLENHTDSIRSAGYIGAEYVNQSPQAARERIASLQPGPIRTLLLKHYINQSAVSNPRKAL